MRSSAGVGMTPPKVLGAPKPTSSVMISSTLGAPLGGTTRGGQQGFDCAALRSILPPNFGGGGGSCLPSMVVVALGEPGTPVVCGLTGACPTVALRHPLGLGDLDMGRGSRGPGRWAWWSGLLGQGRHRGQQQDQACQDTTKIVLAWSLHPFLLLKMGDCLRFSCLLPLPSGLTSSCICRFMGILLSA